MAILNRDLILAADDMKTIDVEVPEWTPEGQEVASVRLRTLTGGERDKFESDMIDQRGKSNKMNLVNLRARLVALCAVDESGQRMFGDKEVTLLGSKSASVLDRLFTAAQKLNGMTQQDVEELTEGFEDGQTE
jgi:hypothetical protein